MELSSAALRQRTCSAAACGPDQLYVHDATCHVLWYSQHKPLNGSISIKVLNAVMTYMACSSSL
jgi:hypothetical protein